MNTPAHEWRVKNGGRFMRRIFFGIGLLLLLAGIACSSKDPIDALMADLEEAAEERNVKGVEKRLAVDFTGQEGISREQALSMLSRYFAAYESVHINVSQVERPTRDHVRFRVSFAGQGKEALGLKDLLPSNASYHFELWFVDEGGTLKIHRAFWNELSGI